MPAPLVIVGAGGHAREVHDVVEALGEAFDFVGFVDDREPDTALLADRGPYLGPVRRIEDLAADVRYVVGLGDGALRRRIDAYAGGLGRAPAVLVHPRATLGGHAVRLGPGVVVCAHASLTTDVTLGRHVHVNVGASIAHDCVLGDYATVSPGARLSGRVEVGPGATIGTGAALVPGVTVGADTVVGAGAVVVRDLPAGVTAVGVPARPLAR